MSFDWQNITAICLVAAAFGYLVRRVWRGAKKGPRCAECTACGPDAGKQPLVTLEPPKRPAPK